MVSDVPPIPVEEPPEPDPFTVAEFSAWRGMLRIHSTVLRELDRQLLAQHGFGIDAYGVLITLVSPPAHTMTIGELGQRRNLSPSGVSRSVDRLTKLGLVQRSSNPDDARSLLVGLTADGVQRLRKARASPLTSCSPSLGCGAGPVDVGPTRSNRGRPAGLELRFGDELSPSNDDGSFSSHVEGCSRPERLSSTGVAAAPSHKREANPMMMIHSRMLSPPWVKKRCRM